MAYLKHERVMLVFIAVMMGVCFAQTILYSQDIEMADISNMATTKIKEILENPKNHEGKKRLITGNVARKIEERQEAGVSFYEFEDEWGGKITVKTLDERLPDEFKYKKFMILGTVELDASTDDPSDVYFHEKKRRSYFPSIPDVVSAKPPTPPALPDPNPKLPETPGKPPIPLFIIILGSIGVTCALVGLGFFIWSITRKSQGENITYVLGRDKGFPPPLPSVNVPTEVVKDTSVITAVVIEHGYLGLLSGDGKESARIDLYKHGDINENGEYVYALSRAIHGDEHRTIKLPDADNLVSARSVHAKLFVNKTTGEFKIAQFYDNNPVAIRRNKGGDVIKLKQGDQPVVLEDKDVITVGRTNLILHKA